MPKKKKGAPSRPDGRTGLVPPSASYMWTCVIIALALGAALGWLRYWMGLFVLAQGAVAGLLIPWLAKLVVQGQGGGPGHPGFRIASLLACLWFASFVVGQVLGFGLAQPWFEPLGWLSRVMRGRAIEFMFGVAATGPVHRGFALGVKGWFWLVLNLIDWAILFFFLLTMPWSNPHSSKPNRAMSPEPRPGAGS